MIRFFVRRAALLALLGALLLPACTSGARRGSRQGTSKTDASSGGGAGGSEVVLTGQDLAPVDAWVKRRRWILGDDVTVTASREYFGPLVSMTERIGYVRREDTDVGGDVISTMTFVGPKEGIDIQTAPRLFIGTGLSVMARRRLTLRLTKTRDDSVPVRIQIQATGKASTGVADQVGQRAEALVMGARVYRAADGAYAFDGN